MSNPAGLGGRKHKRLLSDLEDETLNAARRLQVLINKLQTVSTRHPNVDITDITKEILTLATINQEILALNREMARLIHSAAAGDDNEEIERLSRRLADLEERIEKRGKEDDDEDSSGT